jgi:DNA polymerase elongation subunit (family B)
LSKPFYIDVYENGEDIVYWSRDSKGITQHTVPTEDYCYCFQPDNTGSSEYKDIYGSPMSKMFFKNPWDMRSYAKTRDDLCESDVKVSQKFMIDEFVDADIESPYNVAYWDIEVEFDLSEGKGYPTPDNPFGEINAIQLYLKTENVYAIILPLEVKGQVNLVDDIDNIPVEMVWCRNEKEIIEAFVELIDDVDYLTGWFTAGFDMPYIYKRACMIFGEKKAKTMFCRGGFPIQVREFTNEFGEEKAEYQLVGRKQVDMLELYKKFVPGEKPNFKLDTIVEIELGESKVDYDDDLGSLYRENPQKFYEYALHDVRLLKMLDEKIKIIDLAVNMARSSCALLNDVTGSIKMIEADLNKFCRVRGIVMPDKKHHEKESYPGAVVYDAISGVHKSVMDVDLVSLYPKTMMVLNLSPETMIYQLDGSYDDYIKVITRDDSLGDVKLHIIEKCEYVDEVVCKPSEVFDMVKENGYTISGHGTIFNGKPGLLSEYVSEGFDLRSEYKRLMKVARGNGDDVLEKRYDGYQKVIKVARLNAVYGASGNEFFRFFNINLASSITISAQIISKKQAYEANRNMRFLHESYS